MKRFVYSLLLVISALSLVAQNPTTTYPYLYDQFIEGTVVMTDGTRESRQMNIHLRRGDLHYIDKGVVKEAFLKDVAAAEIGPDIFIPSEGRMFKVTARNDNGCVAEEITGNFESALSSGGAYGVSSTTSATMKLSSVQTDSQVNQNYMNILNEKELGVSLPTESYLWIISPSIRVRASRNDVTAIIPEDRLADWKSFQKTNRVKWKDHASLLAVLDFLSSL